MNCGIEEIDKVAKGKTVFNFSASFDMTVLHKPFSCSNPGVFLRDFLLYMTIVTIFVRVVSLCVLLISPPLDLPEPINVFSMT